VLWFVKGYLIQFVYSSQGRIGVLKDFLDKVLIGTMEFSKPKK